MTTGTIVAVVSDTHVGGSTALCPPKFTIHTGRKAEIQQATYNKAQEWLYRCWEDYWRFVESLRNGRRLVVIHLGDVIDGLHHQSPQVMSEIDDQLEAACTLLRPIVNRADKVFLTYGTEAHSGPAGAYERAIGQELGIRHDWEYYLDIDGVTLDIAHHGRAGRRDWTSAAAGYAAETALDYMSRGQDPPRYILRGHNHMVDDTGEKLPYTRYVGLSCWQLRTAFGYKVAANKKRSDIGGLVIDTAEPDRLNLCKMRYNAPRAARRAECV